MRKGGEGSEWGEGGRGRPRGERTEQERGEPDASVGKLWQVNGQWNLWVIPFGNKLALHFLPFCGVFWSWRGAWILNSCGRWYFDFEDLAARKLIRPWCARVRACVNVLFLSFFSPPVSRPLENQMTILCISLPGVRLGALIDIARTASVAGTIDGFFVSFFLSLSPFFSLHPFLNCFMCICLAWHFQLVTKQKLVCDGLGEQSTSLFF